MICFRIKVIVCASLLLLFRGILPKMLLIVRVYKMTSEKLFLGRCPTRANPRREAIFLV